MIKRVYQRFQKYRYLLFELSKRDFKKKYKRTVFGMLWSVLSPLMTLLIMQIFFSIFFAQSIPHYTIYLFAGNIVFSYFSEATNAGMMSLMSNKDIFAKVNMPKYMFVFSANSSALINFVITVFVFFIFVAIDGIPFHWRFIYLIIPIVCLLGFNIGVGLILSAVNMFFRDTSYLYGIFTTLLMYASAIFYDVNAFPENMQRLFLINPVYVFIKYFRVVVIDGNLPSPIFRFFTILFPVITISFGMLIYKKYQ